MAIAQMDKVTQQNSALVEEIAASATSLEERARGLVQSVGVFTDRSLPATLASSTRPALLQSALTPANGNKRRVATSVAARPKGASGRAAADGDDAWSSF